MYRKRRRKKKKPRMVVKQTNGLSTEMIVEVSARETREKENKPKEKRKRKMTDSPKNKTSSTTTTKKKRQEERTTKIEVIQGKERTKQRERKKDGQKVGYVDGDIYIYTERGQGEKWC